MREAKVFQLFPISLYKASFDIDEDTKQLFYNEEYERMFSGNGFYTKNKYLLHDKKYSYVIDNIKKHLNYFTRKYMTVSDDVNFYLQNSWAVKHKGEDWAQSHSHANSLISGVYYLNTDEKSGNIRFEKPTGYTNLFHESTNIQFNELDNHNCAIWVETPKNGDLFLFPSHLTHSVNLNLSHITRYSVSFNFHIEGTLVSKNSKIDYLHLKNGNQNGYNDKNK